MYLIRNQEVTGRVLSDSKIAGVECTVSEWTPIWQIHEPLVPIHW